MYQTERQQEIIAILKDSGFVSVERLAEAVHASLSSVRRDLNKLEAMGAVKRSYGGAALVGADSRVLPISLRESQNHAEKNLIAQKAATLIGDGDKVIFDWSTTVQHMVLHLKKASGISVITNNVKTCRLLTDCGVDTYCTGGRFALDASYMVGPIAERMLDAVYADALFFSSFGVSADGDVYEPFEWEWSVRVKMLDRAKRKIFLLDSSKFHKTAAFKVCNLSDVDYVVTDAPFDEEFKNRFVHTVFL